jgi:hypothetical protein
MSQHSEPVSVQRLLDEAVKLSRTHFARIVPPVAVPMALAGGLAAAAQIPAQTAEGQGSPWQLALFVASMLVAVLTMALGSGAVTAAALDAAAGREPDMKRAWLTFLRPRVLLTGILTGIGVVAGMLCCVLPGIYLVLLWSVVIPVVLEESRFGFAALSRSAELMQHNPAGGLQNDPRFRVFVVLFAGFLLGYALAFVVQLPLAAVMAVSVARELAKGERADPQEMMRPLLWLQIPTNMLSMALNACTQLFTMSGVSILYFDVRRRREGIDLERAVEQLGSQSAGQP